MLKKTSVFPIVSVAISVISVIIISVVSLIGKNAVKNEIANLGVGNFLISPDNLFTEYLSNGELNAIMECETISSACPIIYKTGQIKSPNSQKDCLIWGIDQNSRNTMNLPIVFGRNITEFDVLNQNKVCLIDSSYAKEIYERENIIGKKISVLLSDGYEELTVIGITNSEQSFVKNIISDYVPLFVYVPYSTMRQNSGEDMFSAVAVNVLENIGVYQAEDSIKATLNEYSGYENSYKIENMMAHTQTVDNILNLITMILSGIAGISLIVAGISVMTVMMFSVTERTHEIGIKKSIGASFWDILFEFIIEAFLISLIGCLIGILLGIVLSFILCKILSVSFEIDFNMIMVCTGINALFGVIFGIYPAICAAKMQPAVALRRN